jgi:Tol biopolymer transport system component
MIRFLAGAWLQKMARISLGGALTFGLAVLTALPSLGQVPYLVPTTRRVSFAPNPANPNMLAGLDTIGGAGCGLTAGNSGTPRFSANGRYVVFNSTAINLIPGGPSSPCTGQIYVFDFRSERTTMVSVSNGTTPVEGNAISGNPAISDNGRFVTFLSQASNLTYTGDVDTNNNFDVYVRDRDLDGNGVYDELAVGSTKTWRISKSNSGLQAPGGTVFGAPSISGDGAYCAFDSDFPLVPLINHSVGTSEVHRYSLALDIKEGVSVNSQGNFSTPAHNSLWPSISRDGRYIAWESLAKNLDPYYTIPANISIVHVYWRDMSAPRTILVSVQYTNLNLTNGRADSTAISADGRYVAFRSNSNNLVSSGLANGIMQVYRRGNMTTCPPNQPCDLVIAPMLRFSTDVAGVRGDDDSGDPSVSNDGSIVAFASLATNLIGAGPDTNGFQDVFIKKEPSGAGGFGAIIRANTATGGAQSLHGDSGGSNAGRAVSLSGYGLQVVYHSWADNLLSGNAPNTVNDLNSLKDVFVSDVIW